MQLLTHILIIRAKLKVFQKPANRAYYLICFFVKSQSATIKAALKAAIALFTKNAADANSKI